MTIKDAKDALEVHYLKRRIEFLEAMNEDYYCQPADKELTAKLYGYLDVTTREKMIKIIERI